MSTDPERLRQIREEVGAALERLASNFKPGRKMAFYAFDPEKPAGSMLVSNASPQEIITSLNRLQEQYASGNVEVSPARN